MGDEDRRGTSKQTRGVIDRIEDNGDAVVLVGEDEAVSIDIPASLLPQGAASGDHLNIKITLDAASRDASEERVRALQERLEKRSSGGGGAEQKSFKL